MMNEIELKNRVNQLVKSIADTNDENAFNELYALTHKVLFKFLRRYTYKENLIQDAIQDTYVVIISNANDKILYLNCVNWMKTIAKNKLFRNSKRDDRVLPTDKMESVLVSSINREYIELVDAIKKLPEEWQSIIKYIYYLGYTLEETAKAMKLSLATIKRRKSEILDFLKGKFTDERGNRI